MMGSNNILLLPSLIKANSWTNPKIWQVCNKVYLLHQMSLLKKFKLKKCKYHLLNLNWKIVLIESLGYFLLIITEVLECRLLEANKVKIIV
jgi:hypothetical protein